MATLFCKGKGEWLWKIGRALKLNKNKINLISWYIAKMYHSHPGKRRARDFNGSTPNLSLGYSKCMRWSATLPGVSHAGWQWPAAVCKEHCEGLQHHPVMVGTPSPATCSSGAFLCLPSSTLLRQQQVCKEENFFLLIIVQIALVGVEQPY